VTIGVGVCPSPAQSHKALETRFRWAYRLLRRIMSRAREWGQAHPWINLLFAGMFACIAVGDLIWGTKWSAVLVAVAATAFVWQYFRIRRSSL
jgi:hypothetical protein